MLQLSHEVGFSVGRNIAFMFMKCLEYLGQILEQVKQFNYLRCELSLVGEPDFDK